MKTTSSAVTGSAIVPADVVAQVEGPGPAVGADLPGRGQVGLDGAGRAEAGQATEEQRDGVALGRVGGVERVERRDATDGADPEDALGGHAARRRAGGGTGGGPLMIRAPAITARTMAAAARMPRSRMFTIRFPRSRPTVLPRSTAPAVDQADWAAST